MIIRCRCNADPAGRWKPPAMIFRDHYREDDSKRDNPVPACREHLSAKQEKEIQERERAASGLRPVPSLGFTGANSP
jgi:hypothetical protein